MLPADAREELQDLPLRAGMVLTDEVEKAAGERAVEILQNHGYPYAQVGHRARADRCDTGARDRARRAGHDRGLRSRRHRGQHSVWTVASSAGGSHTRLAICSGAARSSRRSSAIGALGLFKSIEIRAHDIDAPARGGAHAHYGRRRNAVEVESRPWLRSRRASRRGCAHQPSERVRVGASGSICRGASRASSEPRSRRSRRPMRGIPRCRSRCRRGTRRSTSAPSSSCRAADRRRVSWQWTPQFTSTVSYAATIERSDVDASLDPLLGLEDGMLSAWSIDLDHRRAASPTRRPRPVAAHRAGRRMDARHVQLFQHRWRRASLSRRARRPRRHLRAAFGSDRSIRWGAKRTCRFSSDCFSAARMRCVAGVSTS